MELASMLAEEPFSDHPKSVCPVIGDFLRTYNDRVDDDRRQDLYAYAAAAVGTRSTKRVRRARLRLCAEAAQSLRQGFFSRAPLSWNRHAATYAAAGLSREGEHGGHAKALAVLDRLLAVGGTDGDAVERRATAGTATAPSAQAQVLS
jgi:hypothetical protein